MSSGEIYTGPITNQPALRVKKMNDETMVLGILAVMALVGLFKFMGQVNDSNYGTRNSYFDSDTDYDFGVTQICLTLGAVALIVWLSASGLGTPVGSSTATSYHSYGSGIHRSLGGSIARAFIGRSRGFR